jgi:small subunit ribosomal protein S10
MDQFEQRIHKRLLDIYDPNANTIEALKKLNIPAGIEITIETQ